MSDIHHLLVPYAASASEGAQHALAQQPLPALSALLARLSPDAAHSSRGEETSFSTPAERALAQAQGLPADDGRTPWAAWYRAHSGAWPGDTAWAFLTPCQWQVSTDHVTLMDPDALGLDEAASRALLAIVAPWFAEDGIALHYDQPTRWLAQGQVFSGLATASLERVLRRDVRAWMPDAKAARTLHRLHSEMQMLLYTHPFNDARAVQGLPTVNSFWVHGAGQLPAGATPTQRPAPQQTSVLQGPALREDWQAWGAAWAALDAGPIADLLARSTRGEAVRITLCSDHNAASWHTAPRGWGQRIGQLIRPLRAPDMLRTL